MSNTLKTTLLLGVLTGLIVWCGGYFGGSQGMVVAFIVAAAMNFGSYWFSDKVVLAMYGGREVSANEAPQLFQIVQDIALRAAVPMPRVFIIPSSGANAFATGRNPSHAAIAVTEGILRLMSPEELKGVLAHELSHVKNRDTLISAVAATLAGAIMVIASMARWAAIFGVGSRNDRDEGANPLALLAMAILAPIAASLVQLAISRSREFEADASAARILGSGDSLAHALRKLHVASEEFPLPANPQTAHMFIVNPLGSGVNFARLFSTHPPVEERIARLNAMTRGSGVIR